MRSSPFQVEVFPLLKPMNAVPKDVLFKKGDVSSELCALRPSPPPLTPANDRTLCDVSSELCALTLTPRCASPDPRTHRYFLIKGQVEVTSGVDGRVLYRARAGNHFGEDVLTGRRRSATHIASAVCEMYAITADDLQVSPAT